MAAGLGEAKARQVYLVLRDRILTGVFASGARLPNEHDLAEAHGVSRVTYPGGRWIDIAPGFDFEELWHLFTVTIKACLERAKAYALRFSIENHTHTMMPVTDSFLRLWDAIRDPALGCNLDFPYLFKFLGLVQVSQDPLLLGLTHLRPKMRAWIQAVSNPSATLSDIRPAP